MAMPDEEGHGPGWWEASDGNWYPPESHPDHKPLPPPPPSSVAPLQAVPPLEPIVVKGANGTVTFDGRWVSIERSGFTAKMTVGGGTKQIAVKQITAVQLKPAGMATRGYIQFTVPGGDERRSRGTVGGGVAAAAKDENSVLFSKQQQDEFVALQRAVMDAIS